jgi:hypothetical protein
MARASRFVAASIPILALVQVGGTLPAHSNTDTTASLNPPQAPIDLTGYVHTPAAGFVHKSCIHHIPAFSRVDVHSGDIRQNESVVAHHDPCRYPIFRDPALIKEGSRPPSPPGGKPPDINGWVEYTYQFPPSGVSEWNGFQGDIVVPPAGFPCSDGQCYIPTGGETIYLWSGLDDGSEVLQSVVQWGDGPNHGGDFWELSSWAVGPTGVYYTTPLFINEGDDIFSQVYIAQTNPLWWAVLAEDRTSQPHQATGFYMGPGADLDTTYNFNASRAILANFEAVNVSNCAQLPSDPHNKVTFSNLQVFIPGPGGLLDYQQVTTNMFGTFNSVSPNCSFWMNFTQPSENVVLTF